MRLKGHALYFSLVISLLIGIICTSIILYGYYNQVITFQHLQKQRLIDNVNSGINYLRAQEGEFEEVLDLFAEGKDSVSLKKLHWGLYDVLASEAFSSGEKVRKEVLCGLQEHDNTALYLQDQNRKLSVTGRTELIGDCYLPEIGITRGYIGGTGYIGNQLVQGKTLKSSAELPEFSASRLTKLLETFVGGESYESDSVAQSFLDQTLKIAVSGNLSGFYQGNVVLSSNGVIKVGRNAKLDGVIVAAPMIVIERGFEGNAQFVASDSIIVKSNAKLTYPSVLSVVKSSRSNDFRPCVILESGVEVHGGIVAYQAEYDRAKTFIKISERARCTGLVFSNGLVQIDGAVFGKVVCSSFYLATRSAIYENYLRNAVINRRDLSADFLWPVVNESAESKFSVLKTIVNR